MPNTDLPDFVLIDGYPIDCFLREEHRLETDVTQLPVESGSSIADNLWIRPAVVTVEGIVSSIPLAPIASQRDDPASSPSEAYKRLLAIHDGARRGDLGAQLGSGPVRYGAASVANSACVVGGRIGDRKGEPVAAQCRAGEVGYQSGISPFGISSASQIP